MDKDPCVFKDKQFGVMMQIQGATPEWLKQKIEENKKYKEELERDINRMMFGG